jgi:NADPH:quinone reductase-like Zn-dependent oxidoreductase
MRDLGARETIDYRMADPLGAGPYDLIFDTVGATRWQKAKRALNPGGTYLPLNFAVWDIVPSLLSRLGRKRFVIGVNEDRGEDLAALAAPLSEGSIRPVIDRRFDFDDIRAAYRLVETRHRKGAVVLDIGGEAEEAVA